MLNEFLKVAYDHGKQDETSLEMSKMLSSAFSKEELYALATGEVKLASLCDKASDDCGPASWLERFRDTPLFDQALMLEEEYLQNEQQDLSQRAQDSAMSQTRSQFWQMQDQLRLKKKLLELELEKLQNQAAMAPPVDPTATPMTAATPEPAPEAAQGSGAPQGSMESKVVQASAQPQRVLKEKLWKLASVEMDKTAAPDFAAAKKRLFGKGLLKGHAQGFTVGAGSGAAAMHLHHKTKEEKKEAAFFGMGGNTMGRISALGSRAASAFRPSAAGAVAAKVVPNTIGNLAQNVKSPFGQHQSVEQLFGQMKAMGPKAAPAPMASPNLSGVDMHQGTMRGAVNKATGAVGGALGRASGAVGGAASSAANAVSGAVGGMADKAKGLFNRLSPTARMQTAYNNTAAQAYPLKFAAALEKMAAMVHVPGVGLGDMAKNLGGHALAYAKANPQAAARLAGGAVGAGVGALTGPADQGIGNRVMRGVGGAAVGAGLGHAAGSTGARMLAGAAREGHLGEALSGAARGVGDRASGLKDKLTALAQTAPL